MKIKDLLEGKKPALSFEIFPPKPDYPLDTVYQTITGLRNLKPDFISVTYGAGGSNRSRTMEIAAHIREAYRIESVAHLTCVGHSPAELDEILAQMRERGIENLLALRGDPPQGETSFKPPAGHYRYAVDLVRHIRKRGDFCIGAAAYPEGHKECRRWQDDWDYLRAKVEAGVDFLTTQLFFDNRIFYNFLDHMERLRVTVPILPGIMPVLNPGQIKRMVYLSEASIPSQLLKLFDKYGNDNLGFEKAGIEYAIRQIDDLLANGVAGIHLYTMNRVAQIQTIVENSQLKEKRH